MRTAYRPDPDRGRWRDAWALVRLDFARQLAHLNQGADPVHPLHAALLPGFQALFWYRLARCLWLKGWHVPARALTLMALYLTRADLPASSSIGPSALVLQTIGVCIHGRVGARLTIGRDCLVTHAGTDWPAQPAPGASLAGFPQLGDDVALGQNAAVLGAVTIGDGACIGPGAMVMQDVPPRGVVEAARARILRWREQEQKDT